MPLQSIAAAATFHCRSRFPVTLGFSRVCKRQSLATVTSFHHPSLFPAPEDSTKPLLTDCGRIKSTAVGHAVCGAVVTRTSQEPWRVLKKFEYSEFGDTKLTLSKGLRATSSLKRSLLVSIFSQRSHCLQCSQRSQPWFYPHSVLNHGHYWLQYYFVSKNYKRLNVLISDNDMSVCSIVKNVFTRK
ncbi:uncharacterized protein [Rutidosis leptorrhynchoides]|uniref:uncharacterized protein isoform X2 n=1 Tax=Rutidosis leptorrhynchoides TaxID=125765 RepID=UPI003A9A635F